MRYVEYIFTPESGQYGIDLGYIPTTATTVQIRAKISTDGNLTFGVFDSSDSWFRFFAYQQNWAVFDIPFDSQERIEIYTNTGADYVDYEFGFKDNGQTMYLQNSQGNYNDRSADGYTFNFTDQFRVWGDKMVYADARIYDIKVFENGVLAKHYRPAYDDVNDRACLYDGSTAYYNNIDQYDINYHDLDPIQIEVDNHIIPSSGGSVSGTVIVNADIATDDAHWELIPATSTQSACTLTFGGNIGLTYISGDTIGTFPVEFVFSAWDGSGDSIGGGKFRHTTYEFRLVSNIDDSYSDYDSVRIRQQSPLVVSQPLYLGADEVSVAYLGEDEVVAMYLGEDLVFGS